MKKVIFNYSDLKELSDLFKEVADDLDSDVSLLISNLCAEVRREEFIRRSKEDRTLFARERLSQQVKQRYYQLQNAFKKTYGVQLPEV